MNGLEQKLVACPYCGEAIDVVFDCSISHQNYIEDCQVCCRPIIFDVTVSEGNELIITVASEDE
jgi:hypothetical protein